jgi:hypothetical protein
LPFRKAILLFKALVVTCARAYRSRGKRSAPRVVLTFTDIQLSAAQRPIELVRKGLPNGYAATSHD